MKLEDFKIRINALIKLASETIATKTEDEENYGSYFVDEELFQQLRVASLSFLNTVFGKTHIFYKDFEDNVKDNEFSSAKQGSGILKAAKTEIDGAWLFSVRGIVSAEIFNDFFEMSTHLLSEGYKDPAAVMIGSTLEEHLRFLCKKNGISLTVTTPKGDKTVPIKADVMNVELTKAGVYNLLDQKQVTAWLGLRNSAAHGKYGDYSKEQVEMMSQGILGLISKTS